MELPLLSMALALPYITPAHGFSTFETNCTLPETTHNYISAPNVRSTLDIAWSSLATIIACTYSVLHLNIPEQRDGRDPGWRGDLKWWWRGIKPSLVWTAIIIMAPEYYTLVALEDLMEARTLQKKLRALLQKPPNESWTLVHAHFINMGGYAARIGMEGRIRGHHVHLAGESLPGLLDANLAKLDRLLTDEAIKDRSKSDMFAKTVAILQIAYYCGNCLTRAIDRLPTAQLEVGTLGFAFSSVLSYALYYNKPRSVASVEIIADFAHEVPRHIEETLGRDELRRGDRSGVIRNHLSGEAFDWRFILFSLVFGAIHVAAWNFAFPTSADQWLWRICSVLAMASILVTVCFAALVESWFGLDWRYLGRTGFVIYSIARLTVIVEMIRCLFYLPPDAFITTWATNVPHI